MNYGLSDKEVVHMIADYIQEPNSIDSKWVRAMMVCRDALLERIKREEADESL